MGIKGLSQFLEKNFNFQEVNLEDFKALAIDGNNVCAKLYGQYKLEWKQGGEYAQFSSVVSSFFSKILQAKVKPIVVLDGIREVEKIAETCRRRKEVNSRLEKWQKDDQLAKNTIVVPTLALQTFMCVADKLEIELLVSAGEGDQLVVAISNSTPLCPVLASDSDYFMFDLHNGYLPLQHFNSPKCLLYHIEDLKTQFHLHDTQLRLLIPCIHGNDFIASLVDGFQDHKQTLSELKKYESVESYLEYNSSYKLKYEAAKKQYCVTESPEELIENNLKASPWLSTSTSNTIDFHFCLIRISNTRVNILSNAVEKITRESVWQCSQCIRQYIYGFLMTSREHQSEFVDEFIRQEGSSDIKKFTVSCKLLQPPMTRADISKLKTFEQEDIVLAVLKCHKMPDKYREEFRKLPSERKLFAATVFYWYITSDYATEHLVRALLLCREPVMYDISAFEKSNLEHLHAFSQWQCVYSDAIALNSIANFPFEVPDPAFLFSGKYALFYAAQKPEYLASKISGILLQIFEIATCKEKRKKKCPRQVGKAEAASLNPRAGNPFEILSEVTD